MKSVFALLLIFVCLPVFSLDPATAEKTISALHQRLTKSEDDALSDSLCAKMREEFISTFDDPTTFDYPFDQLQFCKLTSPDHRFRLFNWNLPYRDGTQTYFCFVLVWNAKDKNYNWIELKDYPNEVEKIENKYVVPDKWLGTLYYSIIPMEKKGRGDTYTLLGWDGKDNLTTRKIIDAITITGDKIRFGANIFANEDGVRKRVILEYSNDVSASVKYYPKKGCIVMDHLSPKNPIMVGIYADYGPDGSYDCFLLKKGKWEYIDDIDVSEFSDDNNKSFYDPRPDRRRKKEK